MTTEGLSPQPTQGITPYATVVVDIEGTTTPITFVHDVLFPYVKENLESFLVENWDNEECVEKVAALREQAKKDVEQKVEGAMPIVDAAHPDREEICKSVIANVKWQMSIDRKIGPLKALQGYMWRSAYESGRIKGAVYEDVVPALRNWIEQGIDVYIYSSGSVEAQKLLFGWSVEGNILKYFKGHFDTGVGLKVEKASYVKISHEIKQAPERILFISDNIKEIDAAIQAGYQVAITNRPGNAPLPFPPEATTTTSIEVCGQQVPIIDTFTEVFERTSSFQAASRPKQGDFKLDDLIHLETMFEELGREDGLRDGIHAGHTEGRVAGTERGFEMAREAGFYFGAAKMWAEAAQKGFVETSDRGMKAVQLLRAQAQDFPLENTHDSEGPDPVTSLDRIRGRFKVASSAFGTYATGQRYRADENTRPRMNF
ncbi:2,3-diketo-5-methylthio-1-phosphopentane phosphatase [Spizellomyces punctatus DAOM BR117]|uniref:Enolase-phosphatase E1 n=2 Tax=Spizellomyces punctatus (strain DAOM BR117) TaxID=645134 RepID=A0A0L0HJX8_SPIPD|nr:2,3-diketo-5-methylthio-1-phosphopentane phosphatase [Spizellomyces punctatus DAOM BR117]KND01422.1 2,3-diketo-5-methylthio-1-phosphopentane phosphatase [Spizellomyces punctatus DAOM BR117]|eukprot:XP_016609461.1 2,3-diketo-5-methylthio-1-phosphopentane phosphatase [Spizellomyces punctatus DAOM BR117]